MNQDFDIAIAGLGAMGSAVAWQAARAGLSVVGFDRWVPPHAMGSTHGFTRAIRQAYYEDPRYVPLARRAWELWHELAGEAGRELILSTGALYVGPPDGELVAGSSASAAQHGLPHEKLTPGQVRSRFPAFNPAADSACLFERNAGILFPETCVDSQLALARSRGAVLHLSERVTGWRAEADHVAVITESGRHSARTLVLAAGPWIAELAGGIQLPVVHKRMVQFWFRPSAGLENFRWEVCPVFVFEYEPGKIFYGFPDLGDGVKIAFHTGGTATELEKFNRDVSSGEVNQILATVAPWVPALESADFLCAEPCIYTTTPDENFIIDFHPQTNQVILVSACSGHGFKFSSAIGEAVVQMAAEGKSKLDLGLFGFGRLT